MINSNLYPLGEANFITVQWLFCWSIILVLGHGCSCWRWTNSSVVPAAAARHTGTTWLCCQHSLASADGYTAAARTCRVSPTISQYAAAAAAGAAPDGRLQKCWCWRGVASKSQGDLLHTLFTFCLHPLPGLTLAIVRCSLFGKLHRPTACTDTNRASHRGQATKQHAQHAAPDRHCSSSP